MVTPDELQEKIQQKVAQAEVAQEAATIQISATDQAVDSAADATGRQWVGITIVGLFVVVIIGIGVIEVWQAPTTAAAKVTALLEGFVYPALLLVLGYYFGRATAEAD